MLNKKEGLHQHKNGNFGDDVYEREVLRMIVLKYCYLRYKDFINFYIRKNFCLKVTFFFRVNFNVIV